MKVSTKSVLAAALLDVVLPVSASPWRVLPIWGGGYVQSAVIAPSDSRVWYTYVDVGGPYRSDDGGKSWHPLHANMSVEMRELGFDQLRSMSVDPRDANSIVTLGGKSGDEPGGFGVSRDGGQTWKITGRAFAHGTGIDGVCLARNPFNPDELVGGEDLSGLFLSRDNGESWTRTGPTNVWYTDIRYDVKVPGRVYASSPFIPPERLAKMWVVGKSCTTPRHFGFFRSDDGAQTWRRLSDESPTEIVQLPGDGRLVGIFNRQHVRMSSDGGETWQPFEDGLFIAETRRYEDWATGNYYALAAGRDFWLLGDGGGRKYRRRIADAKWTLLPEGCMAAGDPPNEPRLVGRVPDVKMTALMTLVTDPNDDDHWLATDWYELWETLDAGKNWTSRVKGIMQLCTYDIVFDPNSEDNIFCCFYDMGAFVSTDGGASFRRLKTSLAGSARKQPNNIATALYLKDRPGEMLCIGARGFDTGLWRSSDAGITWAPIEGAGLPPLVPKKSAGSCLAQDPSDGSILLTVSGAAVAGKGGVYRSRDDGRTWRWDGDGLESSKGFDYGLNHAHGAWPRLAVSPDGSSVTAAEHGELRLMTRGSPNGIWMRSELSLSARRRYPLAADPYVSGRFLCCGEGDAQESTDGGRTWHAYAPLKGQTCRAIAFDRHVPGQVVFGCRDGILVSQNGGMNLTLLKDGLAVPSGRSRRLALDRGRLFFMTSGSGVWWRKLR